MPGVRTCGVCVCGQKTFMEIIFVTAHSNWPFGSFAPVLEVMDLASQKLKVCIGCNARV